MKMLEHWLPGDDFGAPLACLATSFTFDSDFFTEDCLSRFLAISTRDPDGASGIDIAGMLEEEELLAETTVCVLVDQSCRPQPRNLRWDLLPVRVPNALLHAKVAVLIWERSARVIIGSANLTTAGYRNQVELGVALDLDRDCRMPRHVFEDLSTELRDLLSLTPGDPSTPGPKSRASAVLDMFDQRIADVAPPASAPAGVKLALAPARLGRNPLDALEEVWNGTPPQSVTALSPFWDDADDMPGASAVVNRLAKRASTGERTSATFVVPVETLVGSQVVRAPKRLRTVAPSRIDASVVAFKATDDRRLHAKCVQYRSSQWMATMFGSSNITGKGLGLDHAPHREINLWIGCRVGTDVAKALNALIPLGDAITEEYEWEVPVDDEDEALLDPLPAGFGEALLTSRTTVELHFTGGTLPANWQVDYAPPGGEPALLLDAEKWLQAGNPSTVVVALPEATEHLPSLLDVRWQHNGEHRGAVWLVNVGDGSFLPPPAELRELSADLLLAILASTRPLRAAIEEAIHAASRRHAPKADELDPLKRFDSSGFLLQRTRRSSAALWGVERRLTQRIHSLDALEWRLAGTLGPEHLAVKLAESARITGALPGEAQFLLAELALTVSRVRWSEIAGDVPRDLVDARVRQTLDVIREQASMLADMSTDPSVTDYVNAVLAEVAQ